MKSSGNGSRRTPTKKNGERRQDRTSKDAPLFAFDTLKEEYNWDRPKRKIKTVSRFDPTTKEKQSGCRIGHGFICPQCSAVCAYDSTKCHQCHLECIYEAGVGVVVLQDRPSNEKAKVEQGVEPQSKKEARKAEEKVMEVEEVEEEEMEEIFPDSETPEERKKREEEKKKKEDQKAAVKCKEKGNELYKSKKFDEALAAYDEAVALDPTNMTFINNKAAVYFTAKKYDECIEACLKAVEVGKANMAKFEDRAKAYMRCAKAYQKKGDLGKAIEMCKESLLENYNKATERLMKNMELEKKKANAAATSGTRTESTLSTFQNKGGTALYKNESSRKKNIFANLKKKIKVATESNLECGQGKNHDDMESRMIEATEEWKESIITEAKNGAYSAASINPNRSNDNPPNSEGEIYRSQSSEAVVPITEPPSMKSDHNCLEGLKQQLRALQLKRDTIYPNVLKAEEEFGDVSSKLEAAILQRNKDAAVFSQEIISCGFKIAEIEKRASSLTAERDEFKKRVEAKGLSSVPNIVPNYSTRIDALQTKMSEMKTKCDAAKEQVKDLMSGNEAVKQCQKEINSLKRQLTDVTAKNSAMATEKAVLIEKVLSKLTYDSKLRGMAENQKARISELESSVELLTADRDTVVEESKKQIDRLEAEKAELQDQIASFESRKK